MKMRATSLAVKNGVPSGTVAVEFRVSGSQEQEWVFGQSTTRKDNPRSKCDESNI